MKQNLMRAILVIAMLCLALARPTEQASARLKSEQDVKSTLILRAARMLDVDTGRLIQPALVVIEAGSYQEYQSCHRPSG